VRVGHFKSADIHLNMLNNSYDRSCVSLSTFSGDGHLMTNSPWTRSWRRSAPPGLRTWTGCGPAGAHPCSTATKTRTAGTTDRRGTAARVRMIRFRTLVSPPPLSPPPPPSPPPLHPLSEGLDRATLEAR
jgi:hypothetical protein